MKKSKLGLLLLSSLALVAGGAITSFSTANNDNHVSVVKANSGVTLLISSLASSNSWAKGNAYGVSADAALSYDDNVKFYTTGSGNNGKYYDSDCSWRLYQNGGGNVIFNIADGYVLSSIKIKFTVDNSGAFYYGDKQISSDTAISVSGSSVEFTVRNSGNKTNGVIKITEVTVSYVSSSIKTLVINPSSEYAKVGESITLTASGTSNLENITWSIISDNDIATLNDGTVTATGYGEVVVSATSTDGTKAEDVTLKFFPLNNNEISVALASDIAKLAGTESSPYTYSVSALVGEITDDSFDTSYKNMTFNLIDDNADLITVYRAKGSHRLAVNDKIQVTGKLQKTSDGTCQFVSGSTYLSYYNVSFTNDGLPYCQSQEVLEGNKVTKPDDPTKEGYTFTGWLNGTADWDFDADLVESDLTLVASWITNEMAQLQSDLNDITPYMSLAYKYNDKRTTKQMEIGITPSSTHTGSSSSEINTEYNLTDDFANDSGISFVYNTGTSKYYYLTDTELRLYKGSTLTISIDGDRTLSSIKIIDTNGKEITSNVKISYDGSNAVISASGTIKNISKFSLVSHEGSIDDVDFRMKLATENMSSLAAYYGLSNYGLEISTSTKTGIKFSYGSTTHIDENTNYQYIILDLGDAINNPARLVDEFTIRAYAEYDGTMFYSSETKTNSIVDMVKTYYEDETTKDKVSGLYNIIDSFGYID